MSLGGSLIVPREIDMKFLKNFRDVINKNTKKYKFVIVCGGGTVARKYIHSLKEDGKDFYKQDLLGIAATRLNARFMAYFFGKKTNWSIPLDMEGVKNLLSRNDIIFCGGLRYAPNQTSDTTAVKLARYLKTDFINMTNVKGLYDKNPKTNKNAKFIPRATIERLAKIVFAIKYEPGMHGPVDHSAMKIIQQKRIRTYLLGKDARQLDNLLNHKKFVGSVIE